MMSSDQRSPNISSETLTGQPERGCDFDAIEQKGILAKVTCKMQVTLKERL